MLCIHIIMNIHEHVWIWYGYALMCVHIVYALFQQTKEQKRKYKIYSVCRWIIEFNGTTKRLSIALLHTAKQLWLPLVHTLLGHKLPGVPRCFLKVFAAEWQECYDGLTEDSFNHSTATISDSTPWPAYPGSYAVHSSQDSPAFFYRARRN